MPFVIIMPSITEYMRHVDGVLQLIRDASGADVYAANLNQQDTRHYEISISKKDAAHKLDASMVTPSFPVRMHAVCDARGNVRKCTGFLCSPLPTEEDECKRYRMNIPVKIGNLPCMTDFLLLHLSFGCAAVRYVIYMNEAIPKHPHMPRLSVVSLSAASFVDV